MDPIKAIEAALAAGPTPGPWRWEVNFQHKRVHLVGGKPQYDLTVIDFERWGTQRATMRLRDLAHDGMNLLFKLHERPDWTAPFPGREHHASWCQGITHPDAAYIAACHPAAIAALIARLREAEADARRYRWHKARNPSILLANAWGASKAACDIGDDPDQATDIAMKDSTK